MTQTPQQMPPGFYPDPENNQTMRWWDGTNWTSQTQQPSSSHPTPGKLWASIKRHPIRTVVLAILALIVLGAITRNPAEQSTVTVTETVTVTATATATITMTATPTPSATPTPAQEPTTTPAEELAPAPAPAPAPANVYYKNCDAAKADGAAPLYAGQPGYRTGLDGDGDGIACEK